MKKRWTAVWLSLILTAPLRRRATGADLLPGGDRHLPPSGLPPKRFIRCKPLPDKKGPASALSRPAGPFCLIDLDYIIFTVKNTAWANSQPTSPYSKYWLRPTPRIRASTMAAAVTPQVNQVII